ncbi:MAG: Rrf2 family transcriptional regulator [Verrucomicrobiota bacterium]
MKVSKRCHYALRALVDMGMAAVLGHPLVRIADLAQKENLPLKFLEQIFLQLKEVGWIESKRGKQGGYFLAVPASDILFGDVIRLLDGPLAPIPCVSRSAYQPCSCPDETHCGIHALMAEVHRAITDVLDRVTLADTVKKTLRKIRRNKAAIPFVKMVLRRAPRKVVKKVKDAPPSTVHGRARSKTASRVKSRAKTSLTRKQIR